MIKKEFFKRSWNIQNIILVLALIITLGIGGYYRLLALKSIVRIRNGFKSAISLASYLFVNPAAYLHTESLFKPEYNIYDSFRIKEFDKYFTDAAENLTFIRNPEINDSLKKKMEKSRSELGWAFILRYVLSDGMKGAQNMAIRITKFRLIIELILITLLFLIGKQVAGTLGALLGALLYAIFWTPVHMMTYITYYYWAIPFSVFNLFFWIVLYERTAPGKMLKKKILLFFFYGLVMGFATATRMIFLFLPIFLSLFILYKERKFKPTILLVGVMLIGQFLLLLPQMIINHKQFGKFAISTRDTWHIVLAGVGIYENPFGIKNSGDLAVFDYIKDTKGIDYYTDGFDAYNKACKEQAMTLIKEHPDVFIRNVINNVKSAQYPNPTAFLGIDTPIDEVPDIEDISKTVPKSVPVIRKYFLWVVLLSLILSVFGSQQQFRMFLVVIAQNIYLILVICLYFPNYLYFMTGHVPSWSILLSLSLAIALKKPFLYFRSLYKKRFAHAV